jgi:VIT1/CCC1 family predicted Fe2+/Mn2+ transporter
MGFPVREYLRRVYLNILKVSAVAGLLPLVFQRFLPGGYAGFAISVPLCVMCAGISVLFIGCLESERKELWHMIQRRFGK